MDGKKIGIVVAIVLIIVGFFAFNSYEQDKLAKESVAKEAKEKLRVQKDQEKALSQEEAQARVQVEEQVQKKQREIQEQAQAQKKQREIQEQEAKLLEEQKQAKKAQDLEIQKANDEKIAKLNEFKNTTYTFNFASNVAVLDDTQELRDFFTRLDLLAEENLIKMIAIEANADNIGSQSYNMKLSLKRAVALNDELQKYKVEIQTKANGEANPIAPNNTEEGRALNRRIEIKID